MSDNKVTLGFETVTFPAIVLVAAGEEALKIAAEKFH